MPGSFLWKRPGREAMGANATIGATVRSAVSFAALPQCGP